MRQPVIGLDVDDVLGDLLTPWLSRYSTLSGHTLSPDDLTSWDIDSVAKHPETLRYALKVIDYEDEVQPMPGALAAVEELRKLGRVIFVTSCPQLYSAQPKYRWLQQHGFLTGDGSGQMDYFPVKDKGMVRMDFLLDDAEHNVKSVQEAGGVGILVRRPHNRNVEWRHNVPGLYAAPIYIRSLLSGK